MADGEGKRDDGRTESGVGFAESTGAIRETGSTSCDVDRVVEGEIDAMVEMLLDRMECTI